MKNLLFILFLWSVSAGKVTGQNPVCPSPFVYMDGGSFIRYFDPGQPLSSNNPVATNIPTFGSGLTLMPNINGGTLSPTFYSTSGGTYWYWSGVSWVNTGHTTGSSSAVNLAGCNGTIYNLVGSTGAVYAYNGTGNGYLLTTLPSFNGGGPYDLQTDCNCNFYALNTTAPNQTLTLYSPSGTPQCSYSLTGMPNTSAGGGFAIIGNYIYVKNNTTGGFYIGEISGSSITFTAVSGFTNSPGDFASCPVCYAPASLAGASINSGVVGCSTPSTGLIVTTTVTGASYSWTGPGIVGPTNQFSVVAIQAGVYSCTVSTGGCPPSQITLTTAVISSSAIVTAVISPTGNICVPSGGSTYLKVAHSNTNDVIYWTGPGSFSMLGPDSVQVNLPGAYNVSVTNIYNGCTGTDQVSIANSPTISLTVSDQTLCAQGFAGSPATVTVFPSGAVNYTLFTSSNFSTSVPNGPVMPCSYFSPTGAQGGIASVTLVGRSGFCMDSITATFSVIPNPVVTTQSVMYNICPGNSQIISISGANTYSWSGSPGLNTFNGSNVIATPASNAVYSVKGTVDGCHSAMVSVSVNILPLPTLTVTPTNTSICFGSSVTLIASSNAASFTWTPAAGLSTASGPVTNASPQVNTLYTITAELSTCIRTATTYVQVVQPPNLGLGLSQPSMCSANSNGSPNSITVYPSGAMSYSFQAPSFLSVVQGPGFFTLLPAGPQLPVLNVLTTTLIGVTGVCKVSKIATITIVPNPTVTITPPTATICPGQIQSYLANGASTYYWQAGGGYTLTAPNAIKASPMLSSMYTVFGSANGCNSDDRNAVLVVSPVPEVSLAPLSSTVCAGKSVQLIASGSSSTYVWIPNNVVPANGSTVTVSPPATQVYTVIGFLNTCSNVAVSTVSVINIPTITTTASEYTICRGNATQIFAYGAQTYQWLPFSSLNQIGGSPVLARPTENTTYTVTGMNSICSGSALISISVLSPPNMQFNATQNTICKGAQLTMSVSGAHKYNWTPKNTLQFLGSDSVVLASPQVNTNYTVTGTNTQGTTTCQQQLSYSVIVIPQATAIVNGPHKLCEGERVSIVAKGGDTYNWTPSTTINNPTASAVIAGPNSSIIYTVHVSYNSYCGNSATVQVNVYPRPKVFAGRDTTFNLNEEILINAIGTGTISWIQGEAITCMDCPETRVYPTRNGCYVAQAINEHGCIALDDVCIDVKDEFSIYVPNSFSPNNDGTNDVFQIYGEGISEVKLDIYDRWGARIFSSSDVKNGWDGTYNGTSCKVDVYTYVLSYRGLNRKLYSRSGHINLIK